MTKKEAKQLILEKTGKPAVKAYKLFELSSTGLRPVYIYAQDGIYVPGKLHVSQGPVVPNRSGYHAYRDWTNIGGFVSGAYFISEKSDKLTVVLHKVYLGDCAEEGPTTAARYLYVHKRFTGADRRNMRARHWYYDDLRYMVDQDGVCKWQSERKKTTYCTERYYKDYTLPTDQVYMYTQDRAFRFCTDHWKTTVRSLDFTTPSQQMCLVQYRGNHGIAF